MAPAQVLKCSGHLDASLTFQRGATGAVSHPRPRFASRCRRSANLCAEPVTRVMFFAIAAPTLDLPVGYGTGVVRPCRPSSAWRLCGRYPRSPQHQRCAGLRPVALAPLRCLRSPPQSRTREMVPLLGPKGMGKATIRTLTGLIPARVGSATFDGEQLTCCCSPASHSAAPAYAGTPHDLPDAVGGGKPRRHRDRAVRCRALNATPVYESSPSVAPTWATSCRAASSRCWASGRDDQPEARDPR
jgi:hypothetical protein